MDITNLSDETSLGLSTLYFITRKNKTDKISAQLDEDVGCLKKKCSLVIIEKYISTWKEKEQYKRTEQKMLTEENNIHKW